MKGVSAWPLLPNPSFEVPHLTISTTLLGEMLGHLSATYLPVAARPTSNGPGSVHDADSGWWHRVFDLHKCVLVCMPGAGMAWLACKCRHDVQGSQSTADAGPE